MAKLNLEAKGKRLAFCGVLGARIRCASFEPGRPKGHEFYVPFLCKNRYCRRCGTEVFKTLFAKHVRLRETVAALVGEWPCTSRRAERVVATIDFTTRNLGRMPSAEEVRAFNCAIKRFFRLAERRFRMKRKSYGVLYCDEFGGRNSNLHAHAVYAGPYLPNEDKELSALWKEACHGTPYEGSFIISIKSAKSFEAALAHALKYTGKFVTRSDPDRLAELEAAFHRVRRVHALAAFYNAVPKQPYDPNENSACPTCGAALVRVSAWCPLPLLRDEGIRDLGEVRREVARNRALGAAGP